jgi:hypothetical protein
MIMENHAKTGIRMSFGVILKILLVFTKTKTGVMMVTLGATLKRVLVMKLRPPHTSLEPISQLLSGTSAPPDTDPSVDGWEITSV